MDKSTEYPIKLILFLSVLFLLSLNVAIFGIGQQEDLATRQAPEPINIPINEPIYGVSSSVVETDPNDLDNDGLTNEEEVLYRTDPRVADSDFDFLLDGEEVHIYFTNPKVVDSDYDYVCDYLEIKETKTNPISADTDNDNIIDGYELYIHGSNPLKPDTDGDGLTDYEEGYIHHTSMVNSDTDRDGIKDGDEILLYFTDPNKIDTDDDGLSDLWEVNNNSDPLTADRLQRFSSLFYTLPALGIVLLIGGLFASVRTQSFQRQTYQTEFEKRIKSEDDKKYLFDLLCSLPPEQELDLHEVAIKLNYSVDTLRDLIKNLFDDSNEYYKSDFSIDNCIIQVHNEDKHVDYLCFYCETQFDPLDNICPNCLEEIVRCRICNKPLSYNDNYTTNASCGIIGKKDDITGFVFIDHICETCMTSRKYNVV